MNKNVRATQRITSDLLAIPSYFRGMLWRIIAYVSTGSFRDNTFIEAAKAGKKEVRSTAKIDSEKSFI